MSATESPVDQGVCEKCGMGVHHDEEGRVACDGCGKTTDACACQQTQA